MTSMRSSVAAGKAALMTELEAELAAAQKEMIVMGDEMKAKGKMAAIAAVRQRQACGQ